MATDPDVEQLDELELADWRRRVAEMYATWRRESQTDPDGATQRLRRTRDELFRSHPQSPLPPSERARFGGLSHYPYDRAWRITARFERAAPEASLPMINLPASGSDAFAFRRAGQLILTGPLAGLSLPVFWMSGYAGGLFVPFRDATSGTETYAAGRYLLDTIKGADLGGDATARELVLDFNLAYHPSCAYDPKWNCPLAPPDARLSIAVRAGERLA